MLLILLERQTNKQNIIEYKLLMVKLWIYMLKHYNFIPNKTEIKNKK